MNAKAVIEQKLAALPKLRKSVDDRMDNLLDALAEGMKKERFNVRKMALDKEKKEYEAAEAEYKEQIKRYDTLLEDINKSLQTSDLNTDEVVHNMLSVRERVSSITDDEERSHIVHKHIEKVTIEATTFYYKFGIHPEGKEAFAKKITVYSYMEKPRAFFFIPYNGKGGVMIEELPDGLYREFDMTYLPRLYDKGKYRRREVERAKRENIKSIGTEQLRKQGYVSMNEMREASRLSYSTLYNAIKSGKMKGKNMFKTWYVKKKDFEAYLINYNPKPRLNRQTTRVVKGEDISREQKLLDAIFGGNL